MIHMNGTGYRDLYEQYSAARAAVGDAITALCKATPNGRDYYPQPSGTMGRAQDEHQARVTKLIGITAELEYILMKVCDQEAAKGNR